jgi:hypothetical protein
VRLRQRIHAEDLFAVCSSNTGADVVNPGTASQSEVVIDGDGDLLLGPQVPLGRLD